MQSMPWSLCEVGASLPCYPYTPAAVLPLSLGRLSSNALLDHQRLFVQVEGVRSCAVHCCMSVCPEPCWACPPHLPQVTTLYHLDRPMYLLGYLAAQSRVYLIDRCARGGGGAQVSWVFVSGSLS